MTQHDDFDPTRIIETLNRHRVDYVLVGGYAAQLYGARRPTYDIDIAPSTALDNLHRLSQALRELGAGIRVEASIRGCRSTARKNPCGVCRCSISVHR